MRERLKKNKLLSYILILICVTTFLALALYDFSAILIKNEQKRGIEDIKNLSRKNCQIIENEIQQYFVVLEKDAVALKEEDITAERCTEFLSRMEELPGMDFTRFGIADKNGQAQMSTGESIQVQDQSFFRQAMSGNRYITDSKENEEFQAIVAVPVTGADDSVKGVLFGELPINSMMLLESLREREDVEGESGIKAICLTNTDGTYLLKHGGEKREKSIEDTLRSLKFDEENTNITDKSQVLQGMENGEEMMFSVLNISRNEIVMLTPVENSSWYLYEAVNREVIEREVKYYQKDMLFLTVKILILFIGLIAVYVYYNVKERKKIQTLYRELSMNEEIYRIVAERSNLCIFTFDGIEKKIYFMNEKYKEFGLPGQCIELSWLLKEMEKNNLSAMHRVVRVAESVYDYVPEIERELFVKIQGKNRFLRVRLVNLFDKQKLVSPHSIGMLEDITQKKENQMMMKREQDFRKSLLSDCMGYLEVNITEDRVIENSFDSGTSDQMRGTFTQLIAFYVSKKVLPEYKEDVLLRMSRQAIQECFETGIYDTVLEYQTQEADGNVYWIACNIRVKKSEDQKELIAYLVYRNIDKRKKQQMKLEKEATYDTLTGAFKRQPAKERIQKKMQESLPQGCCHAFLLLDMDNFKKLNDTLGHMCGDQALINFVKIVKENCRRQDIVCRLGGDEFIIFLESTVEDAVEKKIQSLQEKFRVTYEKDGKSVTVSASIGVVMIYDNTRSFEELYALADKALYRVKTSKKGTYCFAD